MCGVQVHATIDLESEPRFEYNKECSRWQNLICTLYVHCILVYDHNDKFLYCNKEQRQIHTIKMMLIN